jgi:hypothetical protein
MSVLRKKPMPRLAIVAGAALLAAAFAGPAGAQASSLTPAVSAARPPDPNGYIQRWLLLDPIHVEVRSNQQLTDSFVQAALKKEYFPNQFTVIPKDGDRVTVGGAELTWYALDTSGYNVNLFHFAYDRKKPAYSAVYWAVTSVNCPRELPNVRLSVGSNSASIWWLNGKEVIDLYGDRHMLVDDGVSRRHILNKGPNILRVAVINAPGLSNMCARFLDEEGRPVRAFTVSVVGAKN